MKTARTKAFVILDGTLLPIDRVAANTPYHSGKHKRHGMNVQVLTDPFGRLLWASPALRGSTHDLTAARAHGIVDALADAGLQVLGRQGVSRSRPTGPRPVPGPTAQEVEAAAQHHPRQDPLRRRAGHGHPEGLTAPAEAPLLPRPHHRHREGRPRPSPRVNVRLEKAQGLCQGPGVCRTRPVLSGSMQVAGPASTCTRHLWIMEFSTLPDPRGAVLVPPSSPTTSASCRAPRLTDLGGGGVREQVVGLVAEFESVTDPRGSCGVRYRLPSLLALMVCAMTPAGHASITAAAEWCRRAAPEELAAFGLPCHPLTGRYRIPSEKTLRTVLGRLDAAELSAASYAWLCPRVHDRLAPAPLRRCPRTRTAPSPPGRHLR